MPDRNPQSHKGRQIALLIAGTGLGWLGITILGANAGWSHRTLALFDLAALAGFVMAIWMTYGLWRDSRNNRD